MVAFKDDDEGTLLKAILQESAAEVLVFDAETLLIIQANPSAANNLQYSLKTLKKMTPLDCLAPEDGRPFNTLLALLKNGKKRRTALNAYCFRRDGSRYPVEARLFCSVDKDRPVFIYIANDVSQREASRQALAHSESDLLAIVANIPGMAYQVLRNKAGDEFDDLGVGLFQVFIEDLVLPLGPSPNGDHEIAAILRHFAAKAPLLFVLALVNERVLGLLVA